MIILNKENNKKVRIKVRLTEEENEELKRCAAACGLSQSEFIRQLYSVHNSFQKGAKYEHSALEICKEIECLILDLQETT